LDHIIGQNNGPFKNATIEHIFKEIFKAGLEVQEDDQQKELLVSRERKAEDTVVNINGTPFGGEDTQFIFGPCAVESYEQVASVAEVLKAKGLNLIRGGAFKPRTSPYDFQGLGLEGLKILGLGLEGLKILKRVADDYDMRVVSEIV